MDFVQRITAITLKTDRHRDANFVVTQVVITIFNTTKHTRYVLCGIAISGATSDDKVGFMTTLGFQWIVAT